MASSVQTLPQRSCAAAARAAQLSELLSRGDRKVERLLPALGLAGLLLDGKLLEDMPLDASQDQQLDHTADSSGHNLLTSVGKEGKRGALHFAAMRRPMIRGNDGDELACVSALLDAGFDVNEPDAQGEGG